MHPMIDNCLPPPRELLKKLHALERDRAERKIAMAKKVYALYEQTFTAKLNRAAYAMMAAAEELRHYDAEARAYAKACLSRTIATAKAAIANGTVDSNVKTSVREMPKYRFQAVHDHGIYWEHRLPNRINWSMDDIGYAELAEWSAMHDVPTPFGLDQLGQYVESAAKCQRKCAAIAALLGWLDYLMSSEERVALRNWKWYSDPESQPIVQWEWRRRIQSSYADIGVIFSFPDDAVPHGIPVRPGTVYELDGRWYFVPKTGLELPSDPPDFLRPPKLKFDKPKSGYEALGLDFDE